MGKSFSSQYYDWAKSGNCLQASHKQPVPKSCGVLTNGKSIGIFGYPGLHKPTIGFGQLYDQNPLRIRWRVDACLLLVAGKQVNPFRRQTEFD